MGTASTKRTLACIWAGDQPAGALFTTTQRRVLTYLFDGRDRTFSLSELVRLTRAGSGAVQRELAKLTVSELLLVEPVGNQKRNRANPDSPIRGELVAIVRKTFGMAETFRLALHGVADRIVLALLHGDEHVDLLIVSEALGYGEVTCLLSPLVERLEREIHPTVYRTADMAARIGRGDAFLTHIATAPKVWLYGADTGLAALLSSGTHRFSHAHRFHTP